MAVNGIEIKVGQVWSTKDDKQFEVVEYRPGLAHCWYMCSVGTGAGVTLCRNYTDDGTIELVGSTNDCSLDELLSDAPAPKNGVNGVEIKVGQVWLTKDGARVVAIRRFDNGGNYDTLAYPWEMQDADNPHLLRMYNDEGACKPHRINRNRDRDLDKLIPGAVTQVRVPGDTEKLRDKIDAPAPKNGVNGVEIKLGQWWRTADDLEMVVAFKARSATPMQPFVWRLDSLNPAKSTECRWYSDSGETSAGYQRRLTQLIGSADSLAPGPIVDSEQLGFVEKQAINAQYGKTTEPGLYPEEAPRTNPKDLIGDKKLALHLLSPIAEAHWAIGQYAGMLKYGAWNWRAAGVRSSVYISAARRHLAAYLSGEEFDPVDGSHHLGNVMACCAILLEAREIGKLTDDRPPCFSHRPTYEWAEEQMANLKVKYADKSPKHYSIKDAP